MHTLVTKYLILKCLIGTLEEKGFGFCPEITTKLSNMNIDIEGTII